MSPVDANLIVHYPPHVANPSVPWTYFNKSILHQGDTLRILSYVPEAKDAVLRLRVYRVDDEIELINERLMRKSLMDGVYVAFVDLIDLRLDHMETYMAQVVVRGSSQKDESVWEHTYHVLGTEQYLEYHRQLFGGDWDLARYWDSVSPSEISELLSGISLDSLTSILPNRRRMDGRALYELMGPIVTVLMGNQMEGLPFEVRYITRPTPSRLPHIDLTKLLWIFIVLGPCWADICFFFSKVRMVLGVEGNEFYIHLELSEPYIKTVSTNWPFFRFFREPVFTVFRDPVLSEIVKEMVKDFSYRMDWREMEFAASSFQSPAGNVFN